jgi:hypothetical protein
MLAVAQEVPIDPCRLRRVEILRQLLEKLLLPALRDQLSAEVARSDECQFPHLTGPGQIRRQMRRSSMQRRGQLAVLSDLDARVMRWHKGQCTTCVPP